MTAIPPTRGHLDLIQFAHGITRRVTVIVCTQPGEPYGLGRYHAIQEAVLPYYPPINVVKFHKEIQQEPEGIDKDFWDMWKKILEDHGFREGDYIVSSELYGKKLAEVAGGIFMPYDLDRVINPAKATDIRENPIKHQGWILPDFLPYIQKRITLFGAESVGKTTCARILGSEEMLNAKVYPEWARPYLEAVGPEITHDKMERIWEGQASLQSHAFYQRDSIYSIQDTDLFSTIGYWEMWDSKTVPEGLYSEALEYQSDLYVILSSDVTFTPDLLRYGGDKRETDDQYWIDLCERYNLPYVYITEVEDRPGAIFNTIWEKFPNTLDYTRVGREYKKDV